MSFTVAKQLTGLIGRALKRANIQETGVLAALIIKSDSEMRCFI